MIGQNAPLYDALVEATTLLGDPKYAARATLNRAHLPEQKSRAFREAGLYAMRDDWGPDQIHMGTCTVPRPPFRATINPTMATFELYAYGRWLMPDTGFYTYGHDAEGRAWHRQTTVHQTLTLDGKDTSDDGRHLLWASEADGDVLVVENGSYPNLIHRRSVWFVNRQFFAFLDEAHWQCPRATGFAFPIRARARSYSTRRASGRLRNLTMPMCW